MPIPTHSATVIVAPPSDDAVTAMPSWPTAAAAAMSPSTLHQHFKQVTSMWSPGLVLQAQALDASGEQVQERTSKEQARDLVKAAKAALVAIEAKRAAEQRFMEESRKEWDSFYSDLGKMKSREGTVVDADDLVDGMVQIDRKSVV